MATDLDRVETALLDSVRSSEDFLTEIASHLISAGGKRVRPGFCIAAAATTLGADAPAQQAAITGGVAVELVHLGSLYHDDVMDEAETRRTVESVNARWGNMRAILAGDFLLARASELAAGLGVEVAALLAATIGRLCEGQLLEVQHAHDSARTEEAYLRSIDGKTASLLASACRIGGIVMEASEEHIEALSALRAFIRNGIPDGRRRARPGRHRGRPRQAGRTRHGGGHLHPSGAPHDRVDPMGTRSPNYSARTWTTRHAARPSTSSGPAKASRTRSTGRPPDRSRRPLGARHTSSQPRRDRPERSGRLSDRHGGASLHLIGPPTGSGWSRLPTGHISLVLSSPRGE